MRGVYRRYSAEDRARIRDRPDVTGVVIPDIDDPSDPKLRRWLRSRIERSIDGPDADLEPPRPDPDPAAPRAAEAPSAASGAEPPVDEDDEELDRTELSRTTETDGLAGGRRSLEATTQTQSPAGMARVLGKLGLSPTPGRPQVDEVLAQAPPVESRPPGPVIPTKRVVPAPSQPPQPSIPVRSGPLPSGPHRSGPIPSRPSSAPLPSGPLPTGGSGPTRSGPTRSLPLSTGPSLRSGLRPLDDGLSAPSQNKVDPWADEDDEDEAQTVVASPWEQEQAWERAEAEWTGEASTVQSWTSMMRREQELEDDPDTVRHSKMPVAFIGEAVIDDETVLDPSSGSERWRNDQVYQPPPPDIEPASSPLPPPPPRPGPSTPDAPASARPTQRLADGFLPEDEWVPLFPEESEPIPESTAEPGPPPLPQGVRTVQLPEPPSQPPASNRAPTPPPIESARVAIGQQTTMARQQAAREPDRPPRTPAQRSPRFAIVLMVGLAAAIGFVFLGIAMLL